ILANIGVRIDASPTGQTTKNLRGHEWFDVREAGGLTFTVKNGSMEQFTGGSLQMRGGYVVRLADGTPIAPRALSFRIRSDDSKILDVVSGDGKAWFYTDRVMFELMNGKKTLAIRAADLRIAPALANRLGRSDAANIEIADVMMDTAVNITGTDV